MKYNASIQTDSSSRPRYFKMDVRLLDVQVTSQIQIHDGNALVFAFQPSNQSLTSYLEILLNVEHQEYQTSSAVLERDFSLQTGKLAVPF